MNIRKIVDLSIPITGETPIYPGDPKPVISSAATIQQHGYNVSQLNIGSHTGTHVDAPIHFTENTDEIDQVSLHKFIGEGVIINATGKEPMSAITLQDVEKDFGRLGEGKIALFHTGWSKHLGTEKYYQHPYLSPEVIDELLKRGVKTVFIDALNIDPPDSSSFYGHEAITSINGIIGENFMNFDKIDFPNPIIVAFPLKLSGLDGSPVRGVAMDVNG